jgi:hypothetical protein
LQRFSDGKILPGFVNITKLKSQIFVEQTYWHAIYHNQSSTATQVPADAGADAVTTDAVSRETVAADASAQPTDTDQLSRVNQSKRDVTTSIPRIETNTQSDSNLQFAAGQSRRADKSASEPTDRRRDQRFTRTNHRTFFYRSTATKHCTH